MPSIPTSINGVSIEFSTKVNNSVDLRIIDALKEIITDDLVKNHNLSKLYISSANDQHKSPSRHVMGNGKAVDISRINGKKLILAYESDSDVKAVADAIQNNFEDYQHRRENFGPLFTKKLGKDYPVSGHKDHIHLSVN